MIAELTRPLPKLLARAAIEDSPGYRMVIADTQAEVLAAQRLRHRVFAGELGAALAGPAGVDADELDAHCEHLLIKDERTGEVVGTYRILPPGAAARRGALYSDGEFELTALAGLRSSLVEVGRSCVDPAHRNGGVIGLMWAGLARYVNLVGGRWVAGCGSVPLADGGHLAAAVRDRVLDRALAPERYRVRPRNPWPHQDIERPAGRVVLPPLMQGYLRLGAWVGGEPAYDADFGCADFFLLLDMDRLDPRYLRRFQ
ncbi:GNAT family N-acetyltransferase [Crossiella cryophila]|uniref:Putative hemolysin n=1 Tax=Crossiella cryophila TaxID=43355 RepID=A0A7W7CKP4_9PSEU|nr:GNAT family N-acyltransferase [Crossiella cryophila]MBB4681543.1 putative hemolysin [Crossiella cryophila]